MTMKTISQGKKKRLPPFVIGLFVVIVLALSGWGYFAFWVPRTQTASAAATTQTQTAQARRGSLVVSASGT